PLWEYWARAASLIPVAQQPLFRWRMGHSSPYRIGPDSSWQRWHDEHAEYVEAVLREVRERGPLTASQLSDPRRRNGEWWERRSLGRQALEWLFFKGEVTGWRTANFERVYDVPERVLPAEVLAEPTPTIEEAQRTLLTQAARALGVATGNELAGFYRIVPAGNRRVAELVEAGELEEVAVDGWLHKAYVPRGARPKKPEREDAALLSPFDLLIHDRDRTRRLFGFNYQIEVYVPEPKRRFGYYVLPVLSGDELAGRLDLKADRQAGALRVLGAYAESQTSPPDAMPILHELHRLKDWLGLTRLEIAPRGDLAPILASATM
ncbi:MAG: YcaQ family DNA glycosylase, partial [Chloroflexi bacterium]|nr:YcaQ family DNA glycosylase [Chloroflexota bacterium]